MVTRMENNVNSSTAPIETTPEDLYTVNQMRPIILASKSPRRKDLLEQIGLEFSVEPSNDGEEIDFALSPHELARSLSQTKVQKVAQNHRDALIIGADTFILANSEIMGKARSDAQAREMLSKLSGSVHSVITGYTVLDVKSKKQLSESVETKVRFREIFPEELEAYIMSKEPLGKAGAYAIQGLGAIFVERIDGDFSNVVGLPLCALAITLREFDIQLP